MGLEALLEAEIVDERNIITGVYLIGSAYFVSTYVRRRRNPKRSSSLHILVNTLAGDVGDALLAVMCNEYGPRGRRLRLCPPSLSNRMFVRGREPHEYGAGDGAGRWGRTVGYKGKQGVCARVTAAVPRARAQSPLPPALLYSRSIRALPFSSGHCSWLHL